MFKFFKLFFTANFDWQTARTGEEEPFWLSRQTCPEKYKSPDEYNGYSIGANFLVGKLLILFLHFCRCFLSRLFAFWFYYTTHAGFKTSSLLFLHFG